MKHLLLTAITAVLLVGCGESQQSAPPPEATSVEPVAEAAQPEPPTAKASDISIHDTAMVGNIEAVKQHLTDGVDVNAKDRDDWTPLHHAALFGHKEIAELLITNDADVNVRAANGRTPLHWAAYDGRKEFVELLIAEGADVNAQGVDGATPLDWADDETSDLLRKHGGKTSEELKAEGN